MKFLIIKACSLIGIEYDQTLIDDITEQITNDITDDEIYNQSFNSMGDTQVKSVIAMRIRNLKIEHVTPYLVNRLSREQKYKEYRFLADLQIIKPTNDVYVELVELPNGKYQAKYNYSSAYKVYGSYNDAYDDQFKEGSYNHKKMDHALRMLGNSRFQTILTELNISFTQFSQLSGVHQPVISKLAKGDSEPKNTSFLNVRMIAAALGITMEKLFQLLI